VGTKKEHAAYRSYLKRQLAADEGSERMVPNQGHLESVGMILDQGHDGGDFEDYFPQSASGELSDEPTPYYARNVIWIGDEGKMIRADPDYVQHIWGNRFDPDKLASVVRGIHEADERIYFYAPYGTASRIDIDTVAESQQSWEDAGLDRPYTTGDEDLDAYLADADEALAQHGEEGDEEWLEAKQEYEAAKKAVLEEGGGDLGEWVVTVRDGNHRLFGSLLSGEPYAWVRITDNQYQDLMRDKKSGTLTEEDEELLGMLAGNYSPNAHHKNAFYIIDKRTGAIAQGPFSVAEADQVLAARYDHNTHQVIAGWALYPR
jgi:hypothetical protein